MAYTERGRYRFIVKEGPDGKPWLMLEPAGETISLLKSGFIGLDLRDGLTLEEAQDIAQQFNQNITSVSLTQF